MAIKRITTNLIEDGSIGTIDIANNAIVAAKITNGNITTAKLADLNVTAGKLAGTLDLTGKTITVATATTGDNDTSPASTAFVQQEIAALVDSSPSSLNTLNELAAALGDDENFSTTVNASIAAKLPLAGGTMTGNILIDSSSSASIGLDRGNDTSGSTIDFKTGGTLKWYMGLRGLSNDNFYLRNQAGSTDALTILTDGNVGIGTNSPTDKLHIGTNSGGTQLKIQSASGINNCILHTNGTTDSWRTGMNLTLTNGSYEFYDDVNNVSRMVLDSSGKVGIGTSSPSYKLHTSGSDAIQAWFQSTHADTCQIQLSTATTNSYARITNNAGTLLYESDVTADNANSGHQFKVDGAERMRIDSSGRVGIGTNSPNRDLSVAGIISAQTAANNASILLLPNASANVIYSRAGDASTNALPLAFKMGDTERLRITSAGLVGIGIDNPSGTLHVRGETNSNGAELFLQVNNNNTTDNLGAIHWGNNTDNTISTILSGTSGNSRSSYLTFSTSSVGTMSEAMRIDSSGNVGIGVTSPAHRLHINGGDNDKARVRVTNTASGQASLDLDNSEGYFRTYTDAGEYRIYDQTDGAHRMVIDTAGKVGIGTDNPQTSAKGLHVVHDANEGTPSFPSGEVIIAQRNFNSSQGCHIGIIGGSASDSAINFGDKDNSDAGIIRYHHNGDFLGFTTNTTEHWKMLANGSFQPTQQHTKDIGGTNAEVRNIYAQGISFASNANASGMSSELLDDYEEGTWTPAVNDSGAGITNTGGTSYNWYVKVGKVVHISANIVFSAADNSGNAIRISGLPFNTGSATAVAGSMISRYAGSLGTIAPYITGNNIYFYLQSASSSWRVIAYNDVGQYEMHLSITYQTT